jgi:hypothetical protein
MKIKGLLLGTAAGLVAVSGAQAADLPVKAKVAAQYVKICSLYGVGFYYIPGTDTCVQLGGYVRADYYYNNVGGGAPSINGAPGRNTFTDTSPYATRHRAAIAIDARSQTAYGTVRTLLQLGFSNENQQSSSSPSAYFNRALIQFAGFTFGRSKSPFSIWSCNDSCRNAQNILSSDNSAGGTNQLSYTAEFGGGFSATAWIEEQREATTVNFSAAGATGIGAAIADASAGTEQYPDFGLNIMLQQAWGYVGASVVAHNASGGYYSTRTTSGHPDERLGWAAEVGAEIKLPWLGNPRDRFGIDFAYGEGASKYSAGNNFVNAGLYGSGNQVAFGYFTDGAYINGGSVQLTTSWNFNTAIEHYWANNLRTSVYYVMGSVEYNDVVKNSGWFCGGGGAVANTAFNNSTNCNPNFSIWQVGSRTNWSPVPNLNIGLDIFYTGVNTAFKGTASLGANGARPAGIYTVSDQGQVSGTLRIQKNLVAGGD